MVLSLKENELSFYLSNRKFLNSTSKESATNTSKESATSTSRELAINLQKKRCYNTHEALTAENLLVI